MTVTQAELIRRARLDAGMTQVELAQALGVTQQTLSHWETGISEPRIRRLVRVARLLDLRAEDLLP